MSVFRASIEGEDLGYKNIRDGNHHMEVAARELCEELWPVFEPLADPHFINQLQIDFNSRFWEMDLTCMLIRAGFQISCPKPGPDICIEEADSKIWIEAIAPNLGTGLNEVPGYRMDSTIAQDVPEEEILLRYCSALSSKNDVYRSYIEKEIVRPGEAYIVAVNSCRIPFSRTDYDPPRITRSLFPIGQEYVTLDGVSGKVVDSGFHFRGSIVNANNADVPTDNFINEKYRGVSAVLFSNTDCCNRPDQDGRDFVLVHNPNAINQIPEGFIKLGREYVAERISEEEYTLRFNDYRS